MGLNMSLQLVIPPKPLVTPRMRTPKRFLQSMRLHVLGQVGRLGEPFTTPGPLADQRLLPSMDSHVHRKRRGRRKRLVANLALERLLPAVNAHMLLEHGLLGKPIMANGTLMGPVLGVGLQMPHHLLPLGKRSIASLTAVPRARILGFARPNVLFDHVVGQIFGR